jgi:hypothetical protein
MYYGFITELRSTLKDNSILYTYVESLTQFLAHGIFWYTATG